MNIYFKNVEFNLHLQRIVNAQDYTYKKINENTLNEKEKKCWRIFDGFFLVLELKMLLFFRVYDSSQKKRRDSPNPKPSKILWIPQDSNSRGSMKHFCVCGYATEFNIFWQNSTVFKKPAS